MQSQQQEEQKTKQFKKGNTLDAFQHLKILPFTADLIEESLDLLEVVYPQLNPLYANLNLSSENFRALQRKTLENPLNYPLSFVLRDTQNNNKLIGLKINSDFSYLKSTPPQPNYECNKMNYKVKLDYVVLKPELEKNYERSVALYNNLWAIDPSYAGKGLGRLMGMEDIKIAYFNGFTKFINHQYTKASTALALKAGIGAYVVQHIDLSDDEIDGVKLFKDNQDGATLMVSFVNDEILEHLKIGYLIKEKQKLQAKKQQGA